MFQLRQVNVRPVSTENWKDFELLFESPGAPHYCWCMVWRSREGTTGKSSGKETMKKNIFKNVPVGLLAYAANEPVAWCSVAPRETYKYLGGDESKDNVWSLVCFFIKREFRGKGISKLLVQEAKNYARVSGAEFLEAYPVMPDSRSYRFMGMVPVFRKLGFKYVKKAGSKRHVMIAKL